MDNELTDEDYGSMGVEDAAELAELKGLVHALAHPPPPPPAKQYDRKLAVPRIEATKEGDIEEMKRLLAQGASPNHKVATNPKAEEPLRWSALRWAAMAGTEARTPEQLAETPLLENGAEVMRLLIEAGGDVNQVRSARVTVA